MLLGSVVLIAAVFVRGTIPPMVCALIGLTAMHIAAMVNGRRNGKAHLSHHLVRLVLTLVICALFALRVILFGGFL